jgi:hypothetical protein
MTAKKNLEEPETKEIRVVCLGENIYGELSDFEEIVGSLPTDGTMEGVPIGKMMIALGYITARRTDPTVTIEEIRNLPIGSIVMDSEEVNPN